MRKTLIVALVVIQSLVFAVPAQAAAKKKPAPRRVVELHGPDSLYRSYKIKTDRGDFQISVATLVRDKFDMITVVGESAECVNNCTTRSLDKYVKENRGTIGIHGTYFCPPDYKNCAGKVGSFLSPVWNSNAHAFANNHSLPYQPGPLVAYKDDVYSYYHRASEFSGNPAAAIAHYPSLVEHGTAVVESEPLLDANMRSKKSVRGGIGFDPGHIYLVISQGASVVDMAAVFKALGATEAMNLDGGGSAALYYEGRYVFGPGRLLPNAIVFKHK